MERSAVKILLLDDEPFILKMHAHMLRELGFSLIESFEKGALAVEHIEAGSAPDLILLDLSMPGMDGIEFLRHLVRNAFSGRLILVSGEDPRLLQTAERLVKAHGIHILGHLAKPIKPSGLGGMIEEWEKNTAFVPRPAERIFSPDEVRNAILGGELLNYYQPKVTLSTGLVQGVECLARWQHPEEGLIEPRRFIGIAEKHHLIDDLTRVTLRLALEDMKAMEALGVELHIAINLSMSTLRSVDFVDFAASEAARASVSPQNVVFEVTESEIMRDVRAPLEVLARLRLMRFSLSIDDFGTGYSSLSQLRDIPFDELKIDQTFVHRAAAEPTARAIYDASLSLANTLGLRSVAEGVEDRADWDLVRGTSCDLAQGYFIARPMPIEALPAWTSNWHTSTRPDLGYLSL